MGSEELANGAQVDDDSEAKMTSTASASRNHHVIGIPSVHTAMANKQSGSGKVNPLLADIPLNQQLNLEFEKISAFVSTDYEQPNVLERLRRAHNGGEDQRKKQILFKVSGVMRPGEMLALMGPSGSGKTSLLSIISGRAPRAVTTSGKITSNGEKFTKAAKRRVGFVLQDDLLYESLTVWETLSYAASLRLPRGMSAAERRERVEAVLSALGITKCRDTIIGGFFRRGISGGERKRVSIGHELLINPAILMLDEPTSGLDSTTALHLLVTLKQLALGGRAIATTIHQPSSRLYQQLDRLMLLAEGHVAYYGSAALVVSWFSHLGFAMPYGVNVADFLLDLAQGEVDGGDFSLLAQPSAAAQLEQQQQQQQQEVAAVPDQHLDQQKQWQQRASLELQHLKKKQQSAVAAVPLSGPAAIRAIYSSYETFKLKHKAGFSNEAEQLPDVVLALDPPMSRRQKAAAAAAAAAGKDPHTAVVAADAAAALKRNGSSAGNGSFVQRSMTKAGSFLGLGSFNSTAGGDAADDSDDEEQQSGRHISRIWSRSNSVIRGAAAGRAVGGDGQGGLVAGTVRRLGVADRGGASYMMQLQVLLQRSIKVKRFESLSGQRFLQGVIVAVVTGLFWWQRGRGTTLLAASDVVGLLFFELLFPSFTALFSALFTFPNDYRMLLKERASGMYRVSAFYLSSALSDLPMDCALPAMFVIIIYFMGGLRLTAGAFFANLLSLVLNVLVAQSLGLLLGVAFMNPKTAQTVASIIMLSFMLVGGYYVRGIPDWISWVRYLSFVYWGFNLMLKIEFSGATYYSCGSTGLGHVADASLTPAASPGAAGVNPCAAVPDLQSALQLPVNPNASPALDLGVLFLMLVVLRLLIYTTLRQKTKAA